MACNNPVQAFRRPGGQVGFYEQPGDEALRLPCGRCFGCRMDRASSWALRCQHEAQLYDRNSFLTLTYDDEHLPKFGSLQYRDVQLFLKRLRKVCRGDSPSPTGKYPIRFFAAGEYGDQFERPHYHMLLFNFDFNDRVKIGKRLYESDTLTDLWGLGHASCGSVTPASAAYVSQYSLKKVYGRHESAAYYQGIDYQTGEIGKRRPEFIEMSVRPGIGSWWYDQFGSDVLPCDYVIVDGKKRRVPRYYAKRFEESDP